MDNYSTTFSFDPMSQTLEDVLQVIGHSQEESQKNSTKMQNYILQLTFADLIAKSPKETQEKLINESKNELSSDKVIKLFQINFSPEEIKDSYQAATYTIMKEYFSEVSPHLNDDQKKRIASIIQKQYSDINRK